MTGKLTCFRWSYKMNILHSCAFLIYHIIILVYYWSSYVLLCHWQFCRTIVYFFQMLIIINVSRLWYELRGLCQKNTLRYTCWPIYSRLLSDAKNDTFFQKTATYFIFNILLQKCKIHKKTRLERARVS